MDGTTAFPFSRPVSQEVTCFFFAPNFRFAEQKTKARTSKGLFCIHPSTLYAIAIHTSSQATQNLTLKKSLLHLLVDLGENKLESLLKSVHCTPFGELKSKIAPPHANPTRRRGEGSDREKLQHLVDTLLPQIQAQITKSLEHFQKIYKNLIEYVSLVVILFSCLQCQLSLTLDLLTCLENLCESLVLSTLKIKIPTFYLSCEPPWGEVALEPHPRSQTH